jgi:Zn-dependent protease
MTIIFTIAILAISVIIHEVAHGLAALSQGDRTAQYAGRLTLNPISHIDPIGSIAVPLVLAMLQSGVIFGWAKPVPYNPYNLKDGKWGEIWVAFAGPLSNILTALLAGLTIRFFGAGLPEATIAILSLTVLINIVLAFFNLIPLPPLDGSKILMNLFPEGFGRFRAVFEKYGFVATLIFIFFLWHFLLPVILLLFRLVVGI